MSLLSFLRGGPSTNDLSWVLQCLRDNIGDWGMQQMETNRSSEDMLVAFGLMMTGQTGMGLVRKVPSIVPHIGPVMQQVRAFYECFWQLDLLRRCQTDEDRAKVSRIYPMVQLRTAVVTKPYFDSHPEKTKPFMCAFDGRYDAAFIGAVREYIQGKREVQIKETGDLDVDNSIAFTLKLGRVAGITRPDLDLVHEVLRDDTSDAPTMKFLTQFDFAQCKALGLPPSLLRKQPGLRWSHSAACSSATVGHEIQNAEYGDRLQTCASFSKGNFHDSRFAFVTGASQFQFNPNCVRFAPHVAEGDVDFERGRDDGARDVAGFFAVFRKFVAARGQGFQGGKPARKLAMRRS